MVDKPRRRQGRVLVLEPKRSATTFGYSIVTVLAVAVCAAALFYHTTVWPSKWKPQGIPTKTTIIVALIAGCVAALWLAGAIAIGR